MAFPEELPFTEEKLKHDLKLCRRVGDAFQLIAYIVGLIGIISAAANINLVMEPTIWLLLAIVLGLGSIPPFLTWAVAAHLLGIVDHSIKKK